MAYIKDNSIINNNTIETIHNDWCRKNGYPVRWIKDRHAETNKFLKKLKEKEKRENTNN
jgi:hypothetical protein